MKRFLSVFLVFVMLCSLSMANAESTWDCDACGKKGNKSNFCPECGKARKDENDLQKDSDTFLVCDCLEWSFSKTEVEKIIGKPSKEAKVASTYTMVLYPNQHIMDLNSRTALIYVNDTLQAALFGVTDKVSDVQNVLSKYYSEQYGSPGNIDLPLVTKSLNLLMSDLLGQEYDTTTVAQYPIWQPVPGTAVLLVGPDCIMMNLDFVLEQEATNSISEPVSFSVPAGEYTVGEDIPAGTYTITTKAFMVVLNVYKNSTKWPYADPQFMLDSNNPVGKLKLNDGQVIEIVGGSLKFETYQGIVINGK